MRRFFKHFMHNRSELWHEQSSEEPPVTDPGKLISWCFMHFPPLLPILIMQHPHKYSATSTSAVVTLCSICIQYKGLALCLRVYIHHGTCFQGWPVYQILSEASYVSEYTHAQTQTHTQRRGLAASGVNSSYTCPVCCSALLCGGDERSQNLKLVLIIDIVYIPMCSFNCFDISDLFYSLEVSLESARILISQSRGTSYKPLTLAVLVSRSI